MFQFSIFKCRGPVKGMISISRQFSFRENFNEIPRTFSTIVGEFRKKLPRSKQQLRINVSCSLKVRPLDLHSQLDDCIIARAYGPKNETFSMQLLENGNELLFTGHPPMQGSKTSLEIEIPVRSDIDVASRLGDVSIEHFVSDHIVVHAENGDISCRKLNCRSMFFKSPAGGVSCEGVLLGNVQIKAGKHGIVSGVNFQGNLLEVETEDGDILISSIYCDKSHFTTRRGNIHLKNLHRRSRVSIEEGSLSVASLDGSLDAHVQKGDIKVQVMQLNDNSYLETRNGNITLSVTEGDACLLNLSGQEILIMEDSLRSSGKIENANNGKVFRSFQRSHSAPPLMKAVCECGEICLKRGIWLSSLNLGGHNIH